MKELEDRDPNDSIRISILVEMNDDMWDGAEWVESKLNALKEYDEGFYYKTHNTRQGTLFLIDTKVRNTLHDDFKKFLFQARIKFAENIKVR